MTTGSPLAVHEEDATFVDEQAVAVRDEAARIWAMRAGLELSVSAGYSVILRELLESGAEKPVLELCAESAADEVRHAQWCLDLAQRIDGKRREWPKPTSMRIPTFDGVVKGPLLATLHLVAMSCLNETIACERLLDALRPTRMPSARLIIQRILADEVKHARTGWAHLASSRVSREDKETIARWIPQLVEASLTALIEENETIPSHEYREWGLPCVEEARAQALRAIDELVLPGFAQVGIVRPPD